MPTRYKTNFTPVGEKIKCPTDFSGKLRNPKCRVEQTPFEPHNTPDIPPSPKPTPTPPGGIPFKPIPVRPPVRPPITPTPDPDGNNAGEIAAAVVGSVIGAAAIGGLAYRVLKKPPTSGDSDIEMRGERRRLLGPNPEDEEDPDEVPRGSGPRYEDPEDGDPENLPRPPPRPVEDINFEDSVDEPEDVTPNTAGTPDEPEEPLEEPKPPPRPAGDIEMRPTPDLSEEAAETTERAAAEEVTEDVLEAGTENTVEEATEAAVAAAGRRIVQQGVTSIATAAVKDTVLNSAADLASGEAVEAGSEAVGEGGGEGGELAVDAVVGAGEGAGEGGTLEEAAGVAEAAGGGPEDPIGDVVAAGLAIGGAFVAIGGFLSGLFKGTPTWNSVNNATAITGSNYTSMMSKLTTSSAKSTNTTAQTESIRRYQQTLEEANKDNRAIVTYTNAQSGKKAVAIQLTPKALANAIQAYQTNPDIYSGWSPQKLSIMGLNPNMSKGKAAATQTPDGKYIPNTASDPSEGGADATFTTGAGGGNWTYFFESKAYQNTVDSQSKVFKSVADIDNLGNTPAENKIVAQKGYINTLQTELAKNQVATAFGDIGDFLSKVTGTKEQPSTVLDAPTISYIKYKIALTQYQAGLSNISPTPVSPPLTTAGKAAMKTLEANQAVLGQKLQAINTKLFATKAKQFKDVAALAAAKAAVAKAILTATTTPTTALLAPPPKTAITPTPTAQPNAPPTQSAADAVIPSSISKQFTTVGFAQAANAYVLNNNRYVGVPRADLQAMGLNPNLTLGKLPSGQHFINSSVPVGDIPTLETYAKYATAPTPAPTTGGKIARTAAPKAPTSSTQRPAGVINITRPPTATPPPPTSGPILISSSGNN